MTNIDSSEVIEKLTEVLDLLKAKKEPKKEDVKSNEKCDEKCKCPFRKMMSEKEFDELCKMTDNMKKVGKEDCATCLCMAKKVANTPLIEEFEEDKIYQEQSNKECFQTINSVLSLVLLVVFFVFLFRIIKGLYCTV